MKEGYIDFRKERPTEGQAVKFIAWDNKQEYMGVFEDGFFKCGATLFLADGWKPVEGKQTTSVSK